MTEPPPDALMSYNRFDNQHTNAYLTTFREQLSGEVQAHTGQPFVIFQDIQDIRWGQPFAQRINTALDTITFFIPILTPSFFKSRSCRDELEQFLAREARLGRNDLVLPVYFIRVPALEDPALRAHDQLACTIAARQYIDWRELRFEPFDSPKVRRMLARMAEQIAAALEQSVPLRPTPPPSPPAPDPAPPPPPHRPVPPKPQPGQQPAPAVGAHDAQRIRLREILVERFDSEELRTLCFDLGIDDDNLGGEGKAGKARELVAFLERHGRIADLLAIGKQLRPDIDWGDLPAVAEPKVLPEPAPIPTPPAPPPDPSEPGRNESASTPSKNTSPGWKIAVRTLTSAGSFVISLCNAARRHFYGNHFFGVLMRQNRPVLLTLLALPLLAAVAILIVREWPFAPNIVTVPIGTTGQVLELIEIPAGPFLMGSSDDDPDAWDSERPQHELELPTYWIGKTSVTNAQFRPFVEGDGYTNPDYWTEAGWQWRTAENIVHPRFWNDPDWNGDTQPVTAVSWFEAVAYTRWLSTQTGHPYRLPTEAEWEKAARGTDGRIWPWGNEWQVERANSHEAGVGKTTPVGSYPDGASPYGVLDMAGNVYEWCVTKIGKNYPYQIEDESTEEYLTGEDARVIRGGSWFGKQKYTRSTFRLINEHPRDRNDDFGLRLVSDRDPTTTTPAEESSLTTSSEESTATIETIELIPPEDPTATIQPTPPPVSIPEMIEIPAGPFLMGSSDDDPDASDSEKLQHELELPTYWIGKTPVTNAQFRPFVEGDGYTNSDYWTEAGWQWRTAENIVHPRFWDDSEWNGDDYPVVGVSWFEAVAYTRWLSTQTGHEVHLPTEAEWEKAARGIDGRIWPWGNEWQVERANSHEAGVGKTTPVGSYPDGASPYGVLDMAGNVWEWTTTKWPKTYPYEFEDEWIEDYLVSEDQRAIRGGSWSNEQNAVRGPSRSYFEHLRTRSTNSGLRLVSASDPIAKTLSEEPTVSTETIPRLSWIPEMIEIRGGPFLMGSSDDDPDAWDDEKPQHELELPTYWIGKTPVTNAQFRPFVEGDGYTNPDYWTEAGWQWRTAENIIHPGLWDDLEWNGDDYPVVGVSWFEAVAYTRWLSAQTDHLYRLPTEVEWEKAARGWEGWIYPWGNEWQSQWLNSERVIGKTTPVGSYPDGASRYGVLDVAGNVWEWTVTKWRKDYPYQIEDEWIQDYLDGENKRMLRGGSWSNEQKLVRGAFRHDDHQSQRNNDYGLRLVSDVEPIVNPSSFEPPASTESVEPATTVEPTPRPAWIPDMIEIPAGPFLMGSSDDDELAYDWEKPQHEVDLPTYWIGKTEITYAQFRPFMEDNGYTNPDYWTEAGWQWRTDRNMEQPYHWDNPEINRDDYPVVYVSWFEAVAYTRWLSAQTGHPYRLPTEAEWEKAARGTDGRIWPWGNTWQPELLHSGRSRDPIYTIPVGSLPDGASPYGVLDMAGNVWEWCTTKNGKNYPYQIEDEWTEEYLAGNEPRMIRGGSWSSRSAFVRGAFRNNLEDEIYRDSGFRLASSVPPPGHSQ